MSLGAFQMVGKKHKLINKEPRFKKLCQSCHHTRRSHLKKHQYEGNSKEVYYSGNKPCGSWSCSCKRFV